MAMSEEEKKAAAAERMRAARAKKAEEKSANVGTATATADGEKTYTAEEVQEMIAAAIKANDPVNTEGNAELLDKIQRLESVVANQKPQVIQVSPDAEKVVLRFQSECADDNVAEFGVYGRVTGKTGMVTVPKAEWSRFYTDMVRRMLDNRKLIVLSGLDEDEREQYGVDYRDGETLDQKAFLKLLDMGGDLLSVFPNLCVSHQEMVARRFIEAAELGDPRATDRDLLKALNRISKQSYRHLPSDDIRCKGAFYSAIVALNLQDED